MATMVSSLNTIARRVPPWLIYAAVAIYVGWQFYLAATQSGRYLVEPINELEREYGEMALKFIVLGLAISPLRRFTGVNVILFRRAIGLCAFFLVVAHLLVWVLLDVQALGQVWAAIVKQPYVTLGMAGFFVAVPLAATSNNWSIRKLGPLRWRQLHKLTYAFAILGALHFVWLAKGFQIEPLMYLAVIIGLLVLRRVGQRQ